jgi:hypothetical protein
MRLKHVNVEIARESCSVQDNTSLQLNTQQHAWSFQSQRLQPLSSNVALTPHSNQTNQQHSHLKMIPNGYLKYILGAYYNTYKY